MINQTLVRMTCSVGHYGVTFQHFTGAPRAADPSKDACAGFLPQCLVVYCVHLFCFPCVVPFFGIMCNVINII